MSGEAETPLYTSSVTALRIPIIKKGEYDLWCMKMRQYIEITDHILWDIIDNGDQATTEAPPVAGQPSAPKTYLAANARRNNEKALNILLSAIPDGHLLKFHDAKDAKTLWASIKSRFGGNDASKKMHKNLLKQQFETFTVGSREELDITYDRFQNILSMLEFYGAQVSNEDANLKFLKILPPVWHVVATMIRGQPGLDDLEFDDLYNNLKDNEVVTKEYAQDLSSKLAHAPSSTNSDEIICSFFAQQASMPQTFNEELSQIDEDALEEIDIRCGSKERRIVPIQDSNSKALVAQDSQGEIDWSQEFDDEPVTFSMVALVESKEYDWSKAFDDEQGSDELSSPNVLGSYDWSMETEEEPVAFALMATSADSINSLNSKMNYDLKMRDWKMGNLNTELEKITKERDDLLKKLAKWNDSASLQTEMLNSQKAISDKTCIGYGVEYTSFEESDISSGDEKLPSPLYDNFKREKGYKYVPPTTGTFLPPRADVSFVGLDEMEIRNKVINKQKSESSGSPKVVKSDKPKINRNNVIIEDWVDSDDEETPLGFSEIKK
ncbi:hypothetical protein Tco_0717992, partial [Tanacetum coccineum]